jgi:hypothetical protein
MVVRVLLVLFLLACVADARRMRRITNRPPRLFLNGEVARTLAGALVVVKAARWNGSEYVYAVVPYPKR